MEWDVLGVPGFHRSASLRLDGPLYDRSELNTRGNIVDVRLNVLGDVVPIRTSLKEFRAYCDYQSCLLVASNSDFGAVLMLMFVEFGEQQSFGFFNSRIKGKPALVLGVDNAVILNSGRCEPRANCSDGLFLWSKEVMDLFSGPVLAEIW